LALGAGAYGAYGYAPYGYGQACGKQRQRVIDQYGRVVVRKVWVCN
jgi:hypothetical protein